MSRIVDTSVVVKWAVKEEGWEAASALIGTDLIAPDLLRAELANALFKKVLKQQISSTQAFVAQAAAEASLEFLPSSSLSRRALEISIELSHPTYDCFFLALAEIRQTTIVSADARLFRRCSATPFAYLVEMLA